MFFDYKKRKNLFILGIVILATNTIIWSQGIVSPFLSYKVFGDITVGTVIGLIVLYATYLFYTNRGVG